MNLRALPMLLGALLSLSADTGTSAARLESGKDRLAEPQFLPVDEAFAFSARLNGGRLIAQWTMPPGYYLYQHGFRLQGGAGVVLGAPDIPPGKPKVDDYFGETVVYYGVVEIAAVVHEHPAGEVKASVSYQGCADYGLCYPPQVRSVTLTVAVPKSVKSAPSRAATLD